MTQVTNYNVVGAKGVLVQLFEYPKAEEKKGDLIIPLYENYETDGGKPAARIREEVFAPIGKILQISKTCEDLLAGESNDLQVGDIVLVQSSAKSAHNWFVISPNHPVSDFDGKILIHHNNIMAKLDLQNG